MSSSSPLLLVKPSNLSTAEQRFDQEFKIAHMPGIEERGDGHSSMIIHLSLAYISHTCRSYPSASLGSDHGKSTLLPVLVIGKGLPLRWLTSRGNICLHTDSTWFPLHGYPSDVRAHGSHVFNPLNRFFRLSLARLNVADRPGRFIFVQCSVSEGITPNLGIQCFDTHGMWSARQPSVRRSVAAGEFEFFELAILTWRFYTALTR